MKMMDIWEKANEDAFFDAFANLFFRWEDEKEYEDIKDYLVPIKKMIPEADRMYKSPFGFRAKADDGAIKIFFKKSGRYLKICAKSV